jgi:hypothetical protein
VKRRLKIIRALIDSIIEDSDEENTEDIIPLYEHVWKNIKEHKREI